MNVFIPQESTSYHPNYRLHTGADFLFCLLSLLFLACDVERPSSVATVPVAAVSHSSTSLYEKTVLEAGETVKDWKTDLHQNMISSEIDLEDDCDPRRLHPIGTSLEDMLNGQMDEELDEFRAICEKKKEGFTQYEVEDIATSVATENKSWSSGGVSPISPGFQHAYRFLGHSAYNDSGYGWYDELNGITNDNHYWYFVQNLDGFDSRFFKVPLSDHLGWDFDGAGKWQGHFRNCDHVGDIDYYNGIIIAGMDGCSRNMEHFGMFAFFKASNFQPLAYVIVEKSEMGNTNLAQIPWVAVRKDRLFASHGGKNVEFIHEWEVNWNLIPSTTSDDPPEIPYDAFVKSHKKHRVADVYYDGWADNQMHYIQGADFSSDGSLFYAGTGYCNTSCDCAPRQIFVFKYSATQDWSLVRRSRNTKHPFVYQTEGCHQETEGITYFDTNGNSEYHSSMPRGELIVIMLHNRWSTETDDVYIKHYTSIIEVDPALGLNYVLHDRWGEGAWPGSVIALEPGVYDEDLLDDMYNMKVKVVSTGLAKINE